MNPQKDDTLKPCPLCGQHYRAGDATCPHCNATLDASTSPPSSNPPVTRSLGRVMYGPSRVVLDKQDPSDVENPVDDAMHDTNKMLGNETIQGEDFLSVREMYGPASYVPDNLDTQKPWLSYWIWIAILLVISTLVWLLLR